MVHSKDKAQVGKREKMNDNAEGKKVLYLYNDDVHTFDYVVNVLMDICDHDANQAEQCAYITHYRGRCDVRRGELGMMKLLQKELRNKGLKAVVE